MFQRLALLILFLLSANECVQFQDSKSWKPVTRGEWIEFNLESVPMEIKTDSTLGSSEYVLLYFKDAQNNYAGGVHIKLSSPPKYYLMFCCYYTNFPVTLPSATEKIWRITLDKSEGIRVKIHCNDVEVLNLLLSDKTCEFRHLWSGYWSLDVTNIYFPSYDTASEHYRPYGVDEDVPVDGGNSTDGGWIPVSNNFIDADIKDAPLMIKTKSALGSNAEIFLKFFTNQKTDAGGISIVFSRPPQYKLLNCSNLIDFETKLPSTLEKTWSITVNKTAGIRMMVHCNGELVIDDQLSDQMCASNSLSWSRYWSGYIKRVKFTSEDTASTHYKPTIEN